MLKQQLTQLIKASGRELCRYSQNEAQEAGQFGWNIKLFNYKEFQVARTIASGSHVTLEEAQFLGSLVRQTAPEEPIIEIGTLFGFSTRVLTMHKQRRQPLITVDKYVWNPLGISPQIHELATRAALEDACLNHNVTIINQDKDAFYRDYKGQAPALFFCDANHDYQPTLDDLKWAKAIGAKIICGHDYDEENHPGVVRAVKEMGGARQLVGSVFVL